VHLSVGLADGIRRTGMSGARPLLAGVNPRATFKALLDARRPLYSEVATFEIDTNRRSANQVVRAVLAVIGEPSADPADPADLLDEPTPHDEAAMRDEPLLPSPTFGPPQREGPDS
nr:shikimate kinase [Pseudonocardiales bacterium]